MRSAPSSPSWPDRRPRHEPVASLYPASRRAQHPGEPPPLPASEHPQLVEHLLEALAGGQHVAGTVLGRDFLEAEALSISADHCVAFLDPLIESWDIDLTTFAMEIVLNRRLASAHSKRFEFVEREDAPPIDEEPGLRKFLKDPGLSADLTREELAFLKKLAFTGKRPTALYYYRELQNLRDPLHFL